MDCSIAQSVGSCPGFRSFTVRTIEWASVWTLEIISKTPSLPGITSAFGLASLTCSALHDPGFTGCHWAPGTRRMRPEEMKRSGGLCVKLPWNSAFREDAAATSVLWHASEAVLNHQWKSHSGTVLLAGRHGRVVGTQVQCPELF